MENSIWSTLNIILLIVIFLLVVCIVIIFISNDNNESPDKYDWPEGNPNMGHFWTCMDGCYEMQLIYENEFNITPQEYRHTQCSDTCWEKLITNEGDYSK